MEANYPRGFLAFGRAIGIKESALDFGVLHSETPAAAAGVFTRNNFPGHPVVVGREHLKDGRLQTIIVNSGVSNVATGPAGLELIHEYIGLAAGNLGMEPDLILPSSTGVIGRLPPGEKLKQACGRIRADLKAADFPAFAEAIMTTDTAPKLVTAELKSGIRLAGIAKGAGMIEPNMATMLSYLVTDADIPADDLRRLTSVLADRTLNRVSIDSDTSTSDTFVIMANGAAQKTVRFSAADEAAYRALNFPLEPGAVDALTDLDDDSREFLVEAGRIMRELTRKIAGDGEGASKLIELRIIEARDREQALKIGRALINSPLFKTAVRGADPNWGRIVMAVGKVFDEPVPIDKLSIFIGERRLKIGDAGRSELQALSDYLKNEEVVITVGLGAGDAAETLWGCDLTEEYVRINAYYTT